MDYQDRITRDPRICGGEPVVTGTRVTIRTILSSLAEGDSIADIRADFPATEDDVWAVIAFAAASAEDDLPAHTEPQSFA